MTTLHITKENNTLFSNVAKIDTRVADGVLVCTFMSTPKLFKINLLEAIE